MSQEEIAARLGVDRTTYVRYETGLRTPPLPVAMRIAEILESEVQVLFADDVPKRHEGEGVAHG
jgi:DNA-binding XRE family transcriptional regulator